MVWGWDNCMCILPGLVRLDLGLGAVGGGEGDKGIGVVLSGDTDHPHHIITPPPHHHACHTPTPCTTHARPSLPVNQSPILTPPNTGPIGLHDTVAIRIIKPEEFLLELDSA